MTQSHFNYIEPTVMRQKMCEEWIKYIYPFARARDDKHEHASLAIEVMQKIINGDSVPEVEWKVAMDIADQAVKFRSVL